LEIIKVGLLPQRFLGFFLFLGSDYARDYARDYACGYASIGTVIHQKKLQIVRN
jgi:hypothetical protein